MRVSAPAIASSPFNRGRVRWPPCRERMKTCVVRKYFVRPRQCWDLTQVPFSLKIVVYEKAAVVVDFEPVIEMDLIKMRGHHLLAQFVGFSTQEGNLQPGQHGNLEERTPG